MEIVSRTAMPIIFVVLARLLAPEDFGVVATTMIAISFSQTIWDAGLSKALIQTKETPERAADVVFWTNVVLGVVVYLMLFFFAPLISRFFNSPSSERVLQVLAFQVIIGSLTSVQQALFVRDLDFRKLFWIKLVTAFTPGVFSIPMAFFGYGVWALVAGSLSGQLLNLCLMWKRSKWRPHFRYDTHLAQKMLRFGCWVLLEGLGAWLVVWGDNLIIGRFLGVHDLGIYRTGWMMVTIVFGLVLNPFLPVLYPTFSRLQDDTPALKDAFRKVNRIIIALALPIGTGLLLLGPEAATLLFGQKWQGLGFVVGILGLMHGVAWLVGLNAELYRSMGRPDMNTKLMYAQLLYYLPAYYIAAQYGLQAFTWTRLSVALAATPLHVYLCVKMLNVSPFYLWHQGKPMILSSIAMAFGVVVMKWVLPSIGPISHIALITAILVCAGSVIYLGCLVLLDRSFVLQTLSIVKRAVA